MISGIVTAVLLAAFVGIAFWAWSGRNRERWQRAAQLPLEEGEQNTLPACCRGERQQGDRS